MMPELGRFAWSLFGLALWLVAPKAQAWGEDGHRVVGEIAWHYLSPSARRLVSESLTEPGYASLADAATWPDTYAKRDRRYDGMRSFHYVNVPAGAAQYRQARDCPNGCVVSALEQFVALLGRTDPAPTSNERREHIYWIAHLVGDLHQPLHVAHPDGKGGNDTRLPFFDDGEKSAHWIWDVGLIERRPRSVGDDYRALAQTLIEALKPAQLRAWRATTSPEGMTNESLRVAQRYAYLRAQDRSDEPYERSRWPVVAEQLCKAGVRLAAILERALGTRGR